MDESESAGGFTLDDLEIQKTIGTGGWSTPFSHCSSFEQNYIGTFASVKLCKHHGRSSYFALKVMAINEILKLKQVEHVMNEKKILQVKPKILS